MPATLNTHANAVKATPPQLNANMHTGEAFQAIAASCIAQLGANRDGVRALDGESLHQMRVALRRWKSACRLFRPLARPPAELAAEVDWLAQVLGPARDWDVIAETTLPAVIAAASAPANGGAAGWPPLDSLQQAARATARQRREAAAAAVDSARFGELINKLGDWVDGLAGTVGFTRVAAFADQALRRDRRRLARRARHLAHADPPARHRVRIAAKKSRYDAEFFLSLHNKPSWRRYLRRLAKLQDVLGKLNDAAVARQLLGELAGNAELALGAGFVQGYLSAGQADDAARLGKLWTKLAPVRLRVHACGDGQAGKRHRQQGRAGARIDNKGGRGRGQGGSQRGKGDKGGKGGRQARAGPMAY